MNALTVLLLGVVLLGSFLAWSLLLAFRISGQALFPREAPATRPRPLVAIFLVACWILYSCLLRIAQSQNEPIDVPLNEQGALVLLGSNLGLQVIVSCVLIMALTKLGQRGLNRYGIDLRHPNRDIVIGLYGYLLATIPVYAVNAAMAFFNFRREEDLHPLLQILREQQSLPLVTLMIGVAVIMAPIEEELIFRVIFQGTLQRVMSPAASIIISSMMFAAVHGYPDMVGLFPLAVILGYFYWKTGSYLTVVTIHAMFNGVSVLAMLIGSDL